MGNDLFMMLFAMYYLAFSPATPGVCPPDMTYIPPGEFIMGSDHANQSPFRRLKTDSYCVDTYEYPNKSTEMPMTNVDFEEAERLCELTGKRLCTETEWEKACRGPRGQRFAYGQHYQDYACGDDLKKHGQTFPSGYFAECKSYYDVFDMTGGVAEWTASSYVPYPDNQTQKVTPSTFLEKSLRSLSLEDGYCSNRKGVAWHKRSSGIGFRCCLSFDAEENEKVKDDIWQSLSRF